MHVADFSAAVQYLEQRRARESRRSGEVAPAGTSLLWAKREVPPSSKRIPWRSMYPMISSRSLAGRAEKQEGDQSQRCQS